MLLEVRNLSASGEVVADCRQGNRNAPARQAFRIFKEFFEQGAQHQVGEGVQCGIHRAGEDEQHGLAVDQVRELQLFWHRHDLLDPLGQHAVHCGEQHALDACFRVGGVVTVLKPAHEHLRVFLPQRNKLVDGVQGSELGHAGAVILIQGRGVIYFSDEFEDSVHTGPFPVQQPCEFDEGCEEIGSTVLPVGFFCRGAAGR